MQAPKRLRIKFADETILKQTEAEKLTADVVQTETTTLIKRLAEKEFKTQFSQVCHVVTAPIKVNSEGTNSPFLKKLIEENKDFIAFVTTRQTRKNNEKQPETEKQNGDVVQAESTIRGD